MTDRTTADTSQGPVAQMVEQRPCKSQAAGSIPGQDLQTILWIEPLKGGEFLYSRDYFTKEADHASRQ